MDYKPVNITFVGDISLNDKGKFKNISIKSNNLNLVEEDFFIANLEAIASIGEYNHLKKPRVTTDLKSLDQLKTLGINIVTLAHNHIFDGLLSGFEATIDKLEALGIQYLGAGLSVEDAEKPLVIEKNNVKIGFLNYCTEDTNPSLPKDCKVYLNWFCLDKIKNNVKDLKKQGCDHVVLLLHWGGKYEGGYFPSLNQINDAKFLSRLDVSLIVGHHPHTLQPCATYNSLPTYFSLGNFIFFDVHHDDTIIKLPKRRKRGGLLKVSFYKLNLKDKLFITEQRLNSIMIKGNNIGNFLRKAYFNVFFRYSFFKKLYHFKFKFFNPIGYFLFVKEGGYKKFTSLNSKKIIKLLCKK